jgi:hypothetical protein
MMMSAFDEAVKRKCGRLSLEQQARTGFYSKKVQEDSFYDLYKNPAIQEKFGVRDLALSNIKPSRLTINGEGVGALDTEVRFGFVPEIIEAKPREKMFNDKGAMISYEEPADLRAELASARRRIELLEGVERQTLIAREEEALGEAEEARSEAREEQIKATIAQQVPQRDLIQAYRDYISSNFESERERRDAGLPSYSDFVHQYDRRGRLELLSGLLGGAENLSFYLNVEFPEGLYEPLLPLQEPLLQQEPEEPEPNEEPEE